MPSFKPKSQEEFEEEFRRRVSTEGREKYLDEWKIELGEESAGRRPSTGSQRTSEDGRRRLQFQAAHGVGENSGTTSTFTVPESSVLSGVQHDVVSSVKTTFSKLSAINRFLSPRLRGGACDDPGKQFAWEVPSQ